MSPSKRPRALVALLACLSACSSAVPPIPPGPASTWRACDGTAVVATAEEDGGSMSSMKLDVAGLWTNPNPLGTLRPPGGLTVADDVVIDAPGIACPRRADDERGVEAADPGVLNQGWDYGGGMFAYNGVSGVLWRGTELGTGTIDWTSVASVGTASPDVRLPYATAAGDLYLLSNTGPLVLDGPTATPVTPGAPRALDFVKVQPAISTGSDTAIAAGNAANYRIVIGFNDAEGKPVLGQPSGPAFLDFRSATPGTFTNVSLLSDLPAGLTTANFVQVYRTISAPTADPGDTMYLVLERPLTASEVTSRVITLTDIVPDALVGTPLYTNPDLGGVRSNNVRPPLATDAAPFRNRLWLSDTTSEQRLLLRLIAPIAVGSTLTINGQTYTAVSGPTVNPYNGDFIAVTVASAGSVALAVEATARNLIHAINLKTTNTQLYAAYVSGAYDAPGQVSIYSRTLGASAFTASSASTGASFTPDITTPISSSADVFPNRLHYSKDGMPYAFPLPNTLAVGAQEHAISRIVALRDALLVFKERGGDGLWKVTGAGPFYVEQVNASVHLLNSDALTVVNNTVYAVTESGIIAVTESSVDDVDLPVEDVINALLRGRPDALPYIKVFGREALGERKVYFGFPAATVTGSGLDYMADTFVLNLNTDTWTKDRRPWQGAYVNGTGRMVRFTAEGEDVQRTYVERVSGDALADRLGVSYAIGWNVETAQAPDSEKQFYQVAVLTKEAQPQGMAADLHFTADDGTQSDAVHTGGDGSNYIRAEVPWDRQRTSRLAVEMRATVASPVNVVGLTATYRLYGGTLKGR